MLLLCLLLLSCFDVCCCVLLLFCLCCCLLIGVCCCLLMSLFVRTRCSLSFVVGVYWCSRFVVCDSLVLRVAMCRLLFALLSC